MTIVSAAEKIGQNLKSDTYKNFQQDRNRKKKRKTSII